LKLWLIDFTALFINNWINLCCDLSGWNTLL